MDPTDIDACLRVLERLAHDRTLLASLSAESRHALLTACGRVARPTPDGKRRLHKALRKRDHAAARVHDDALIGATLNRTARRASEFVQPASAVTASRWALLAGAEGAAPNVQGGAPDDLLRPRSCYVCKQPFRRVHHFYDSLCPACAELNFKKRHQTARLDGRVALVTGARIKIGYHVSLMLLRAGAQVIATTRFPNDAARRFAAEPDFQTFQGRLHVYGLDLRQVPAVELFARHLARTLERLDVIVNNAAQTVRRPPAFYAHLSAGESLEAAALPEAVRPLLLASGALAASPVSEALGRIAEDEAAWFPAGQLDLDGQQVDLRRQNSWRLTLAEVSTVELVEVHLVNAVAPFVLTARLRPLMEQDATCEKHVINVSAMEAQFARNKKTDKHPHTNMAKAALNMMTRTSAVDFARAGIHMNSVDTGWITDEDPLAHVARKQDLHDFHPPLDAIDGAARVLDPLFSGLLTRRHPWGLFFKDYRPVEW